jgi:hypothetical protein
VRDSCPFRFGNKLGFPNDTPESARRDIEIIKKEMPLDVIEFFFLTPLPSSEDHKILSTKGVPLDPDLFRTRAHAAS